MENVEIIIENIEIKCVDFKNEITWYEANAECDKLGDGWRLPTIEELKLIYFYSVNKPNSPVNDFGYNSWPIVWSSVDAEYNKSCARTMFFKDYYDGYWEENVLTLKIKGPKISTEPNYRAGEVTNNQKEYNARFIAVRANLNR